MIYFPLLNSTLEYLLAYGSIKSIHFCLCFEIGSFYVALFILKLTQRPTCLCLQSAGIKGVCCHTWLQFLSEKIKVLQ